MLRGSIRNVAFYKHQQSQCRWREINYRTPLNGQEREAEDVGEVGLMDVAGPWQEAGASYYITTSEVHTLEVGSGGATLLLFQYADKPLPFTNLYTKDGKMPDTSGLYRKMMIEEWFENASRALEYMKR